MSANSRSIQGLSELVAGLANLRVEEKYSDFVIECGELRLPVHKVIICSRSEHFDKVCWGRFLVSILSAVP